MWQRIVLSCIIAFVLLHLTNADIIGDVTTGNPVIEGLKQQSSQLMRDHCVCEDNINCNCCFKVGPKWPNLQQDLCAKWRLNSTDWDLHANISLNGATLFSNKFSPRTGIPPICYPVALPLLPLFGCFKIHSLALHSNNTIHFCANLSVRFTAFDFIDVLLGCLDIGPGGIQIVEPQHEESTTASAAEISLETSNV